MASKMPRLQREKLAFLYSSALEAGDFEKLTSILDLAVHDGVLAHMLREIDEVYEGELEQSLHPGRLLADRPRRPLRPVYWVALAASIALIFVAVLGLRPDDTREGTGALQTPVVTLSPTAANTPTPTVTPTAQLTEEPVSITPDITPAPTLDLQIPPVVIPGLDIEIPAISVPGVVIPTVEIHIPEVVVTVDVSPWGDQP